MKKKEKFISHKFNHVHIYLNELRQIEEELKKTFDNYKIEDSDSEYANLDEMLENNKNKKNLRELNFYGSNSKDKISLSIDFNKREVYVHTLDSEKTKGIRLITEDIIRSTISRPKWFFSLLNDPGKTTLNLMVFFFVLSVITSVIWLFTQPKSQSETLEFTYVNQLWILLIIIIFLSIIFLPTKRVVRINLINRDSKERFFEKNKELFKDIFKIAFGTGLGILLAKWFLM